jgi:hypothetical protein
MIYIKEETKLKPYRCPNCGLRNETKENLNNHFKNNKTCNDYALDLLAVIQGGDFSLLDKKIKESAFVKTGQIVDML